MATPHDKRVPIFGAVAVSVVSLVITAPALVKVDIAGAPVPVAFYAVVSIGVIGLYWCLSIPIRHRPRMGSAFQPGEWTLGSRYKLISVVALADVVLVTVSAFLPTSSLGVPWIKGFGWKYVNYTILVVPGAMCCSGSTGMRL